MLALFIFTGVIGDHCLADLDCDAVIPFSNCTNNTCYCDSGHYSTNANNTCKKSKFQELNY